MPRLVAVCPPLPQVFLPRGYLAGVYQEMCAAGAVCVADEVQCGFGRVGRAFWAFELQGVVPDIVTFGELRLCSPGGWGVGWGGGGGGGGGAVCAAFCGLLHLPMLLKLSSAFCQLLSPGWFHQASLASLEGTAAAFCCQPLTTPRYLTSSPACDLCPQASPAATASPWRAW